jgi:formylglycine-generating enzyme required for sulfatase activity
MRRHLLIAGLAAIVVVTPALALGGFRDTFADGSKRMGPSMVRIPATRFVMGSAVSEMGFSAGEPRHAVELSAYAIGEHEITNAEFGEFLNAEGNRTERRVPWLHLIPGVVRIRPEGTRFVVAPGFERHPVVGVTWLGARAYTRWLTKMTGRHYRLPTEAEWECAARAGAPTPWPWGDRFEPSRLNWRGTDSPGSMPVGSFTPNAWGVHDMLGNVWEWVIDSYSDRFYFYSPRRDPVNFDPEALGPVIRGGSFRDSLEFCRPGFRVNYLWQGNSDSIGFRVSRHER